MCAYHPASPKEKVCLAGRAIILRYIDIFGGNSVPCSVAQNVQKLINSTTSHLRSVTEALEDLCSDDLRHLVDSFRRKKHN